MAVLAVDASAAPGVFDTDIPASIVSDSTQKYNPTSALGTHHEWRTLLRQSGHSRHRYAR